MDSKFYWQLLEQERQPRFWLALETENLLIGWDSVREIRASGDFLNLQFSCEFGKVMFSAEFSLQELFENLQMEKIRRIDGTKLHCRVIVMDDNNNNV